MRNKKETLILDSRETKILEYDVDFLGKCIDESVEKAEYSLRLAKATRARFENMIMTLRHSNESRISVTNLDKAIDKMLKPSQPQ